MAERARVFWQWLDNEGRPIPAATCEVRQKGTATKITEIIYAFDDTDTAQLANPFTTDTSGIAQFYLTSTARVDLFFSKAGYSSQTITLDVTKASSAVSTEVHIADTIDAHDASAVSILDTAAGYTATEVEGALAEVTTSLAGKQALSAKGVADGYASLDAGGDVPVGQLGNAPTPAFVGAVVLRTAVQSIPNATNTAVNWTAENVDSSAMHDNTTNPERQTIPAGKGGQWLVGTFIEFAEGTASERVVHIFKNGSVLSYFESSATQATRPHSVYFQDIVTLAVGDYLTVVVRQSSGGALNVNVSSRFVATFLGA